MGKCAEESCTIPKFSWRDWVKVQNS
jgi:hypothetical protein